MDAVLHMIDSPAELFEYARWDWKHDQNFTKFTDSCATMKATESNDSFHGNQDKVYNKFVEHKVTSEASLMDEVISEIKTLDFDETRWAFARRLTEGTSVDINRYLDGQERCWDGVRRARKAKKVVRIYSGFGGHCSRSKEELAVNGAMAVTMCEILESVGIGVELWAATLTIGIDSDDEHNLLQLIKVKACNDYADLGMINYITGDSHVFRNTVFRSWCRRMGEAGIDTSTALGRHGTITKEVLEGYDDGTSDGIIVIPSTYELDEAKKWMADELAKLKESII